MYRYIFRFVIATLTILTANLITTKINDYMVSYKYSTRPLAFTFIGMAIIVVIFYPLFMKLEEWVSALSVKIVKSGRSLSGKYLGLLLTFILGILVLFYFYAKMWYHIDFFKMLVQGKLGGYL